MNFDTNLVSAVGPPPAGDDGAHKLFISHGWSFDSSYTRITWMLNDARNFSYINYSAPEYDPLLTLQTPTHDEIAAAITLLIQQAPTVLVLSGIYSANTAWMQYELDEAVRLKKYIIGVNPWGQSPMPAPVSTVAHAIVGWKRVEVVAAILKANQ